MRKTVAVALCGWMVAIVSTWSVAAEPEVPAAAAAEVPAAAVAAEDEAAPTELEALKQQWQELATQRKQVRRELTKVQRKCGKDPDVQAAKDAMNKAVKAYKELLAQKVAADEAGAQLLKQQEQLDQQYKDVRRRLKALQQAAGKKKPKVKEKD